MSDSQELSIFENQGLTEQQASVCSLVAMGKPVAEACKRAGITEYRYYQWVAQLPAFEQAVRGARAMLAERHLAQLDELVFSEPDTQRLGIMQRHFHWKAGKLIPKVYGDKLDITLDARIEIGEALAAARARATLRPMCDSADIIDGQVIDSTSDDAPDPIDKQSTLPGFPDIFS